MTDICTHNHDVDIYVKTGRLDPTRTTALREQWVREMNKRFRLLRGLINKAIIDQDCFGMMSTYAPPSPRAFAFPRTADKVAGFMTWLDTQVKNEILQVSNIRQVGQSIDGAWTNKYVHDSYKQGVIRARYELDKAGFGIPSLKETGGIGASMSTPFHMDRVGALYTRVFTGLKGITDTMDQQISQILGQGLIDGDHPRLLARKLNSVISGQGRETLGITDSLGRSISPERRARMLARTEVIRAHHQAIVQEYENWKVEGVNVMAEWVTAGYNVCPECQDLEMGGPYTIEEVRNMLPAHPNCRCTTIPVKVESVKVVGKESLLTPKPMDINKNIIDDIRHAPHSISEDTVMKVMNKYRKTDGLPRVIDKKTMDKLISSGKYTEMFRGVKDIRFTAQFREGKFFAGKGVFGNGTYVARGTQYSRKAAKAFANGKEEGIMRMTLSPDAKTITHKDLLGKMSKYENMAKQMEEYGEDLLLRKYQPTMAKGLKSPIKGIDSIGDAMKAADSLRAIAKNPGRVALAEGYDAIIVEGEVFYTGTPTFETVILNRTKVIVQR